MTGGVAPGADEYLADGFVKLNPDGGVLKKLEEAGEEAEYEDDDEAPPAGPRAAPRPPPPPPSPPPPPPPPPAPGPPPAVFCPSQPCDGFAGALVVFAEV